MKSILIYLEEKGFSKERVDILIDNYIEDYGLNGWDYLKSLNVEEGYKLLEDYLEED
jgi:hypothetical protein